LLQGLVFEIRQDLDDLWFHMDIMEGKETQFLQLLSPMQDAYHPSAGEAHTIEDEPPVSAPAPPLGTSEDIAPIKEEDVTPVKEEDATPVEEEPSPLGDPMLDDTSMDAWPHYNPTN
jgi:hypothetical protein